MSVVNAEERAGRDFIATGFCTKHEKRENLYNKWDDLESKVKFTVQVSRKKHTIQFNCPQGNKKSFFFFLHLHTSFPAPNRKVSLDCF